MKHSRSSLFLMEMIIAILFFSLASAVCIQLFAKSHLLSAQTVNQNHAVTWAQNLAESYLSLEGDLDSMKELFDAAEQPDEVTLLLAFDSGWNPCSSENASFLAELKNNPGESSGIMEAQITITAVSAPEAPIYSLSVMHHTAERRDSHE